MKILLSLLLCLCCGLPSQAMAKQPREFTATVFPVWLILHEVTRNAPDVNASLLLPATSGCPHDYAMTPNDRRRLAKADVLVINGLGLESFLGNENAMKALMKPTAAVIDASKGVAGLLHSEEHDHGAKGHSHACGPNPHIFAAPSMMAQMALSVSAQLAELDSTHAALYEANGKNVAARLADLAAECKSTGDTLASRAVIAQHDIFDYLARDMGLTVEAHIQPHDGQEPSARGMLDLVRLIRAHKVAAVLTEPQYPARTGRTLAAETGIPCLELDPAAHGPEGLNSPLDWYEKLMRTNLRTLEQALGTR